MSFLSFFNDLNTVGSDISWLSNNAFLVFGVVLLFVLLIVVSIIAVR